MVSESILKLREEVGITDKQQWLQLRRAAAKIFVERTSHLSPTILWKDVPYSVCVDAIAEVIFPCNVDS